MNSNPNHKPLKSMRPLERAYLEQLARRDLCEKKAFQMMFEDFGKYNKEVQNVVNKNNELMAKLKGNMMIDPGAA